MSTIKVGNQEVKIPDSLDLYGSPGIETGTDIAAQDGKISYEITNPLARRFAAFLTLFPDAETPDAKLPAAGHPVFILCNDPERSSKFVHTGSYGQDAREISTAFYSDGGWFEVDEVALWAYVPSMRFEKKRREAK